jgi:hypothetical protein
MAEILVNALKMVSKYVIIQVTPVIFSPVFKIKIVHAMNHVLLFPHLLGMQVFQDAMVVIQDPA